MKNFWQDLPKPFTALAPMDGVTDAVFRQIVNKIGRPNVFFTEFVNCEGLLSSGREKIAKHLKFKTNEKPIVAQIWGIKPENFYETAKYVKKLGFSGIDINMGCPDKTVVRHGACSALIKNPSLAKEIIQATKEGVGNLPVSVKTRIGFEAEQIDEWIVFLLKLKLSTLIIHLRTVRELSKVPAHWELMPKIIKLRNKISPTTIIVGNGDIKSMEEIKDKYEQYKCEGFMVGEGIFVNPWLFNKSVKVQDITTADRLDLYLKQIKLFDRTWGKSKNPETLKKFCKTYVNNFPDASNLRIKLMQTKTTKGLIEIIYQYRQQLSH